MGWRGGAGVQARLGAARLLQAVGSADLGPAALPRPAGDIRTVDKLVDGTANTTDDVHMWLAPVRRQLSASVAAACSRPARNPPIHRGALPEAAQPHNVLLLRLARPDASPLPVWGLLIHNYNKNLHDTARGVKRMLVLAGGLGGRCLLDRAKHWCAAGSRLDRAQQ